ncbi:MAG TPA: peptide chain release factor N(5)-glutamine methyltransferase [Steroidobacteraceae bacterium]|nr:peptide chain release factor N(5)-glutamine methyltransferase [Steroidobacteraceae bacterium]
MKPTPSIAELLWTAAGELRGRSESPRLDAEVLLGKVLGQSRAELIVHAAAAVDAAARERYADLLRRRRAGAPVAYLTGVREFWSLPLAVTPAVLVPRPDTETLVEAALLHLPADRECAVLDLGTGSGAIALAIASERPLARLTATDISRPALDVARRNAQALSLSRIDWRLGSWFEAVANERFDAVLANPPYIGAEDPAIASLGAEPLLALTPGASGLEALEQIIAGAGRHLRDGGLLAVEHGSGQRAAVAALFARHEFTGIRTLRDRGGRPRVTLGKLNGSAKERI